ncbi:cyclic pyranopterin phosphate synthase [Georgenia satyanarayanai]|uniref:GTP 3',8-cyclase n=1 Tax=Georgenia satyanarayanai TaxID=860221 RepID=A0A2Y9A7A1_9MICO|nr:GTP 3',8-cyclase MoaA [Georgenia satyanarayanai]PYG01029.1 cyclic pyranopterin phosphate synthase [Georgenia satyanarayanai]SSA39268.1 cyclic pyranopterin phosphate synthase [Georgenia satyanarayanai]
MSVTISPELRRPLVDRFGRVHTDLRISLTDKCSLRCTYCMPAEGVPWLHRDSILTTDELVRVAEAAAALGIATVRLTGGEPLLRKDVVDVVARLARITGPDGPLELSMTTNGLLLPKLAPGLAAAGLRRVNISLDTLRAERFHELTRRDRFTDVLDGIEAARDAGLAPLKINTVAMRDVNDDEIVDLVRFAAERELELRFIEQMPLDAGHVWSRVRMVTGEEILEQLATEFTLTPLPGRASAPAERFLVDDGPTTVGVIRSVTKPFCGTCDRVRITADGQLRNCLFSREESDLLTPLREGGTDDDLARVLHRCIAGKLPGHGINDPGFLQPDRPMSAIGG